VDWPAGDLVEPVLERRHTSFPPQDQEKLQAASKLPAQRPTFHRASPKQNQELALPSGVKPVLGPGGATLGSIPLLRYHRVSDRSAL